MCCPVPFDCRTRIGTSEDVSTKAREAQTLIVIGSQISPKPRIPLRRARLRLLNVCPTKPNARTAWYSANAQRVHQLDAANLERLSLR